MLKFRNFQTARGFGKMMWLAAVEISEAANKEEREKLTSVEPVAPLLVQPVAATPQNHVFY